MHIYYMTKTKEDQIVDDKVQKNINDKERVLQNAKKLISNISQRKSELEREHDIIVKCCARFAHFLQNNAITPFSDFYKEYIGYLITRERSLGVMANMATVQQLQKLLNEYEEAKISFDEALKLQKKLGESDDSIQDLYKLKHNGKKIKELYECQKKSRSKEHEYSEYIHKVVSTKSSDSKGAKKKDKENKNKSEKKHKEDKDKNKSEKKNKEDKSDKKKKDGDNQDTKKKPKPQRNVRYENQQPNQASRRPRTPPPPYAAPSQFHHPPYGAASYHQLPTPLMPPHVPGPHTPPAHDSYVPPYKANYGPKDYRKPKSSIKPADPGGRPSQRAISQLNKKPNTGPSTNYYGDSYAQDSHPPPHGQYPPPHQGYQPPPNQYPGSPGPYQHEPYPPQHQAYPPHQENYHPQRGAYQLYRGAYQPHRGAYNPSRDRNVRPPHYGYPLLKAPTIMRPEIVLNNTAALKT
ncbi:hypothetical protein NQ318_016880 [Aromia moschata]|uniref:Uncharacterized protein n=1 Tax=Aromia moschata TaxID=1265417 RepID=A0AAV8X394_9CUCU|nr:hypothetical protein NQ318_016880 [Aromia moschata]